MANAKGASPTWIDVKASLHTSSTGRDFMGCFKTWDQASNNNQAFVHARLGLGPDQLRPFKATISQWINPDLMRNQPV